jgi:branched-chain amino acid transport system ATP-binding protein
VHLLVTQLGVSYGGAQVLSDVSMSVAPGEAVALLGPNGAGKSTLLRAICGLLGWFGGQVVRGDIQLDGHSINGLPTHEIVRRGLALVPEGRRLFATLTVRQNLETGFWPSGFARPGLLLQRMEGVLALFPLIADRLPRRAGTLSAGEQQIVAIARALMSRPALLVIDEPSVGLSPLHVDQVFQAIDHLRREGTAILLVEQNVRKALHHADRAYVLSSGHIALQGGAAAIASGDSLRRIFFNPRPEAP